ncbi:XPG I-region [Aspergillus sclerotialis]|uniref:XPG I-region n=1 Tax=Aspergillus sclerotialis TaxID=2070753 RepID=A0A3A2ZQ05_9EURO|nr:XPG I-region [Aspergillus sclerotialis]
MGIPGLINAIGSGERISLSKLAVTHLEVTSRPIRVAVDISIWLFQVQAGRGGTNPELRTLFYRLLKFLALPVHPLFVYDGRAKPPFKRGKAVSGHSYGSAPIIRLSKTLIDLFKFPRHDAPGEAEAECANLQRAGVVDAVMSNDVDALMFGSTLAVMNFSKENGSGTSAATHVTRYQMQDEAGPAKVGLDRAGMILFAMLSGGDYLPSGVPKCGSKLAAEIAKAGFGQDLLDALESDPAELDIKLSEWRERLQYELEENESGYFQTKHKAVRIPETFPDRTLLSYYAKPIVSTATEIESLKTRLANAWDQEVDVLEIRSFVAQTFDWNYRSGARKVIRLLAEPLVSHRLRLGRRPSAFPVGMSLTSNSDMSMLHKVYKSRTSFSTDGLPELQLDMLPIDVVGLDLMAEEPNPPLPSTPLTSQETADLGEDEDDPEVPVESAPQSPTKKRVTKRYDPYSTEKIWIFETIAEIGIPEVVRKWKKELADKASTVKKTNNRKSGPKKRGPIDPGMKHGSILKYGTLTKERSEIPQHKQAPLFDSGSSTPPKSSPSMFYSFQEPPSSSMRNLSPRYMGIQPYSQPQIFDDLDEMFSCFFGITPTRNVKRHPMYNRNRVGAASVAVCGGDTGVEALEASIGELSLDSPSPSTSSRGIRMSYSNTSYQVFDHEPDMKAISISPAKADRRTISRKPQPDSQISEEIQALENSLVSISLLNIDIPDEISGSQPNDTISDTPSLEKMARGTKIELLPAEPAAKDSSELYEDLLYTHNSSPASNRQSQSSVQREVESTAPLAFDQCEESNSDPKPRRKSKKMATTQKDQTQSQRNLDRTESINGSRLTIESGPDAELAPVNPISSFHIQAEGDDTPNCQKHRSNKQKRTRRVSIIDLT